MGEVKTKRMVVVGDGGCDLLVDANTGSVEVWCVYDESQRSRVARIARVNLAGYRDENVIDLSKVGYWTKDGRYVDGK